MSGRNSSVELLRILSMVMVLTVHFVGAAFGLPTVEELSHHPTAEMLAKNAVEAFAIVGVNCFVLISGYYGIRASWRGISGYVFWCLFASMTIFAIRCVDAGIWADGFFDSLRVFSATDLWFVPAYLALYLLSPMLNRGLVSLDSRNLLFFVAALLFLNVCLGWFCGGKINPSGYNVMQMLLLYVVGYVLRRFQSTVGRVSSAGYFVLYFVMTVFVFSSTFFTSKAFFYNSPFVLLSSVCLFLCFVRLRPFCSDFVNRVAASAFMVYLLHKPPYIWLKLRGLLWMFDTQFGGATFVAACVALMAGVFIASVLIDQVRLVLSKKLLSLMPGR